MVANRRGNPMSLSEKLYLGLVILSFALALASQSHGEGQVRKG